MGVCWNHYLPYPGLGSTAVTGLSILLPNRMQSNMLHSVGTLLVACAYTTAELGHLVQKWFPDDLWTLNLEQSIVRGDYTSNVLYFTVLIFCAPIWEEVRPNDATQTCYVLT